MASVQSVTVSRSRRSGGGYVKALCIGYTSQIRSTVKHTVLLWAGADIKANPAAFEIGVNALPYERVGRHCAGNSRSKTPTQSEAFHSDFCRKAGQYWLLQAIGTSTVIDTAAVYCTDIVVKSLGKTSVHQQGWAPQNIFSWAKIIVKAFY